MTSVILLTWPNHRQPDGRATCTTDTAKKDERLIHVLSDSSNRRGANYAAVSTFHHKTSEHRNNDDHKDISASQCKPGYQCLLQPPTQDLHSAVVLAITLPIRCQS
jgi:hypothetical protein